MQTPPQTPAMHCAPKYSGFNADCALGMDSLFVNPVDVIYHVGIALFTYCDSSSSLGDSTTTGNSEFHLTPKPRATAPSATSLLTLDFRSCTRALVGWSILDPGL